MCNIKYITIPGNSFWNILANSLAVLYTTLLSRIVAGAQVGITDRHTDILADRHDTHTSVGTHSCRVVLTG